MRTKRIFPLLILLIGAGVFAFNRAYNTNNILEEVTDEPGSFGPYEIDPPVKTNNLQVFLIYGTEELGTKNYTTLEQAMDNGSVTVHELGNVNQLSIDNKSDDYIFIHSGDIVKGGQQDRTLAYDVIIPPGAENVALESFCVERGRWQERAGEAVDEFNSTTKMLSSKELKMAAKYDNDQSKVWQNVTEEQEKLNYNISQMNGYDVEVKSGVSETSLQLTLENEELEKAKTAMIEGLKNLVKSNPEAIGYAYAINGEIYGADIYNNRNLFEAMWDKISESIVIEAISNRKEEPVEEALVADVVSFMQATEAALSTESKKSINSSTDFKTMENEEGDVVFSTMDKDENKWIHKNYMKVTIDNSEQKSDHPELNINYQDNR